MKLLYLLFIPLFLFADSTSNAELFQVFTILPPLVAIILAFVTKDVILSLFLGILTGTFMISLTHNGLGSNNEQGFIFMLYHSIIGSFTDIVKKILNSMADSYNAGIALQVLTIGGAIALITKSGGTKAMALWFAKKAKEAKSSQLATWLMGWIIFFDDYANCLIVGPIMRPVTDKFKVSREKLAFIIDSTAAPIAGIAIISTWIGLELSLIKSGFDLIEFEQILSALGLNVFLSLIFGILIMMLYLRIIGKKVE